MSFIFNHTESNTNDHINTCRAIDLYLLTLMRNLKPLITKGKKDISNK